MANALATENQNPNSTENTSHISIQVREEVWENQRWRLRNQAFCSRLLITDRPKFSNEDGTQSRKKNSVRLPSDAWRWTGDWEIETSFDGQDLEDGWMYAWAFPQPYSATKNSTSFVRRRKWFRIREYLPSHRWHLAPSRHSIPINDECNVGKVSGTWAVGVSGEIYFKGPKSLSHCTPAPAPTPAPDQESPVCSRTHGVPEKVDQPHRQSENKVRRECDNWTLVKDSRSRFVQNACQLTLTRNGTPIIVTKTGELLLRTGISPTEPYGTHWQTVRSPPGDIFQISAGQNALWVITRDWKCWVLNGKLESILAASADDDDYPVIQPQVTSSTIFPFEIQNEWLEIPGKMKAISISRNDRMVLAIGREDNKVYHRTGVSKRFLHGQDWNVVTLLPARPRKISVIDEIGNIGACWCTLFGPSTRSSCRPVPGTSPTPSTVVDSDSCSDTTDDGRSNYEDEVDDDDCFQRSHILCIPTRKRRRNFSVTIPDNSSSNKAKDQEFGGGGGSSGSRSPSLIPVPVSPDAQLYPHLKGILQLTSGVFSDILVPPSPDCCDNLPSSSNFTYINYLNSTLASTAVVPYENGKQIGPGSRAKFQKEAELKVYHPLEKGFLAGSEILIDIVIPLNNAKNFSFSLHGKDPIAVIFKFKCLLEERTVVRNSRCAGGVWGTEETDGVFPFSPGQAYTINIACGPRQFLTTVWSKYKFMYSYNHRFPPGDITHMRVAGDVDIAGILYDASHSKSLSLSSNLLKAEWKHVEFRINPALSHFGGSNESLITFSREGGNLDFEFDVDSKCFSECNLQQHTQQDMKSLPPTLSEVKEVDPKIHDFDDMDVDTTCNNFLVPAPEYRDVLYLRLTSGLRAQAQIQMEQENDIYDDIISGSKFSLWSPSVIDLDFVNDDELKSLEREATEWESPAAVDLNKWLVYSQVQCEFPGRARFYSVFPPLVTSILEHHQRGALCGQDMKKFWLAGDKLVDNFVGFMQNIHQEFLNYSDVTCSGGEELTRDCIQPMCQIISLIQDHLSPVPSQYLVDRVEHALFSGAGDYVTRIMTSELLKGNELEALINIGRLLITDLRKCCLWLNYSCDGERIRGIDCFETTYRVYDAKYGKLVESVVTKTTSSLLPLALGLRDAKNDEAKTEQFAIRDSLFLIYLTIKDFVQLSTRLSPEKKISLKICSSFHAWFLSCVPQWLESKLHKMATQIIPKAVEKNVSLGIEFEEGDNLKFSSSANDTLRLFYDLYHKELWTHLCWPDVENKFAFGCFILRDLSKCVEQYADTVYKNPPKFQIESQSERGSVEMDRRQIIKVFKDLCLTVSNLEYMGEEVNQFTTRFDMEKSLEHLRNFNGEEISKQRRQTYLTIVKNATDYVKGITNKIFCTLGQKMEPIQSRLLQEATIHEDAPSRLNHLLDFLNSILQECKIILTPTKFHRFHSMMWEKTLDTLFELIQLAIERKMRPQTFEIILGNLDRLQNLFFPPAPVRACNIPTATRRVNPFKRPSTADETKHRCILKLTHIQDYLNVHMASTENLILKYAHQRYIHQREAQKEIPEFDMVDAVSSTLKRGNTNNSSAQSSSGNCINGWITIRTAYLQDSNALKIEILNCRSLKSRQANGRCDPYIRVEIVPRYVTTVGSKKTGVQKDTSCPLFDETFTIPLKPNAISGDGLIYFKVNNNYCSNNYFGGLGLYNFGKDEFLGEAFFPLKSISSVRLSVSENTSFFDDLPLQSHPQLHLLLTVPKPCKTASCFLNALSNRPWDAHAVQFSEEENHKLGQQGQPGENSGRRHSETGGSGKPFFKRLSFK